MSKSSNQGYKILRTCVVTTNGRFHERLHPFANDDLLVRAEVVRLVCVVDQTKTVFSGIDILVDDDLVTQNVDVSFDRCNLSFRS